MMAGKGRSDKEKDRQIRNMNILAMRLKTTVNGQFGLKRPSFVRQETRRWTMRCPQINMQRSSTMTMTMGSIMNDDDPHHLFVTLVLVVYP
jgi:hypothetical protein